jgi:phosphoribosyl-ATP pyrophosphohydrolase/phosphoribosyl-AMP cyclohydrolase
MRLEEPRDLERIDFAKLGGLVPVVAQDVRTGVVLMVAFADREALEHTLRERRMWYFSRARATLWRKGETSGNEQRLRALHLDCDADTVLALVEPAGPACHTGARSCFEAAPLLQLLDDVIAERAALPDATGSYTARLLGDENLRLKKLGEEAAELVLACARGDAERAAEETADLLYHALVAARGTGVDLAAVLAALDRRRGSAPRPGQEQAVDGE